MKLLWIEMRKQIIDDYVYSYYQMIGGKFTLSPEQKLWLKLNAENENGLEVNLNQQVKLEVDSRCNL